MPEKFFFEPPDAGPVSLGRHDGVLNYPSHYHPALEAIFVLQGSVTLLSDAGAFQLSPGDIALISALVIHGYVSTENSQNYTAVFENEPFQDVENFIPINSRQQVLVLRDTEPAVYDRIISQLRQAAHYQDAQDIQLCVLHSKILLTHLLRAAWRLQEISALRDRTRIAQIRQILMFIQAHYQEKISLDMISLNLHMDKFEVSRIINQHLGASISDLVNKYRLLDACRLLETTQLSMPLIAAKAGFASESAMYRNFKKVLHSSPIQFRKGKRFPEIG